MKYHFDIKQEEEGVSVRCIELPDCFKKIDNKKRLDSKLCQLLSEYLFTNAKDLGIGTKKRIITSQTEIYEFDVPYYLAFPILLRHARLKNNFSYKEASDICGLKGIILDYERYEMGELPSLPVFCQIVKRMPGFPIDIFFQ